MCIRDSDYTSLLSLFIKKNCSFSTCFHCCVTVVCVLFFDDVDDDVPGTIVFCQLSVEQSVPRLRMISVCPILLSKLTWCPREQLLVSVPSVRIARGYIYWRHTDRLEIVFYHLKYVDLWGKTSVFTHYFSIFLQS